MRLYFGTFEVETFIPITKDNIEQATHAISFVAREQFLGEHPFISQLRTLLESHPSPGKLATLAIRVKADFRPRGDIYYVDIDGVVQKESTGQMFLLTEEEKKDLEKRMNYFVGVIDLRATMTKTSEQGRKSKR
ncbi:MAG: hypothetical protein ACRD2L_25085 [Terriglobia bacterium]